MKLLSNLVIIFVTVLGLTIAIAGGIKLGIHLLNILGL